MTSYSAFFYGTLLHPKILKRVIGNDGSHLQICPAVLLDHTRHKVKEADYPGIVPYAKSRVLLGGDLNLDERAVRGSLVQGLSQSDINYLDIFEGDEYTRQTVQVHPLEQIVPMNEILSPDTRTSASGVIPAIAPAHPKPLPERSELAPAIECQTYLWRMPVLHLEKDLWTFEEFVATNGWKWIGDGLSEREDYQEVERRRRMQGTIVRED